MSAKDIEEKKEYKKPSLTVLGKVSELTAGGSARGKENDENGMPIGGNEDFRP